MLTVNKTLKQALNGDCLPQLGARWHYFNHGSIRRWLRQHKLACPAATLNRYLHDFTRQGVIHSAGRGWYSTLANPFVLDHEPVTEAVGVVTQAFPLLDFSCWSTAQVNPWMHHLLGSFVVFLHTDRDALDGVYHRLKDLGWHPFLNPTRQEAAKTFEPGAKTVVLRPAIKQEPVHGHYAAIEKILVDLVMENQALQIMDAAEFQGMAGRLASSARITMAWLVRYAERRKVVLNKVFTNNESIIST